MAYFHGLRPADLLATHAVRLGGALLPRVRTRVPGGALTFDDGPCPSTTPALIATLGRTRGTFFLLADRAAAHPDLVAALAAAGHRVALHGPDHADPWRTRFDAEAWDRARATLEAHAGTPVRYVRPPYGHLTPALLRWARTRGLEVVLWDVMGRDFGPTATTDRVVATVVHLARPASIVVLHEGAPVADLIVPTVARLLAVRPWQGLS